MFGGSGSGPIFILLNSLVVWVARHVRNIKDLIYVDDSFSVEEKDNLVLYGPYGVKFPSQQAHLLELWDKIGIPHKQRKQIYGSQLSILGIQVDVNHLTFMLLQESKDQLSKELSEWCQSGVRKG